MATKKQIESMQANIDLKKWYDSECGEDKCGTYDFCMKCDKSKDNPCARAFYASNISNKNTSKKYRV